MSIQLIKILVTPSRRISSQMLAIGLTNRRKLVKLNHCISVLRGANGVAVTINDLARICNVSRGTVDRALHGRGAIDPKTKARILSAAQAHGFLLNHHASSLKTGRSRSVGLIVFDLNNAYFTRMVSAAQHEFLARGLFCFICLSDKDKRQEQRLIEDLVRRQVDGIALLPINEDRAFSEFVQRLPIPVVTISNRLQGVHHVGADGDAAVRSGMSYFREHNYRTVHFVCPPARNIGRENLSTQLNRLEGYRQFRAMHPDMRGEEILNEDYLQRVRALVMAGGECPGFFCSSDHYAFKLFRMAREEGLAIPDSFALMGFDGMDNVLNFLEKKLTTIHYPAFDIGTCAADMLSNLIEGEDQPMEHLLECKLLPGETV